MTDKANKASDAGPPNREQILTVLDMFGLDPKYADGVRIVRCWVDRDGPIRTEHIELEYPGKITNITIRTAK